jgi:hypothetical protein
MADTVRTLSALQALLPDNTSKAISAQDLRDVLISAVGSLYGRAVSASDDLDANDIVIAATGGAGGITLTLPAVATSQYKVYAVVKVDAGAGAVTLDPAGAEQIRGTTTYALSAQYAAAIIWCDGTAWHVLANA